MSQRQCLPIDDEENEDSSDSEMDYDVTQISALKYLQKVRNERKKIPQIVTSSIPVEFEVVTSTIEVVRENPRNIYLLKNFIYFFRKYNKLKRFPMSMIQQKNGSNCRLKIFPN